MRRAALGLLCLCSSRLVEAREASSNTDRALQLLEEGLQHEAKGDKEAACELFAQSVSLQKGARNQTLLGICLRDDGDDQGAITAFEGALGALHWDSQYDRELKPVIEAELEKVPRATIVLDVDKPSIGLRYWLDGQPLAIVGNEFNVALSRHTLLVEARGYKAQELTLDYDKPGRYPQLIRLSKFPSPSDAGGQPSDDDQRRQQRGRGYVVGSGGLAVLAVAGGLELLAHSKWNDGDYTQAESIERTAIVTGIVGGLALAGGAWLVIDAWPRNSSPKGDTRARVTLRLTGTGVQGSVHW